VRERITYPVVFPPVSRQVIVQAAPLRGATASGLEVHKEKVGKVAVQRLYRMRCECGRSWIALVLPKFVKCPACHKLGQILR
jgi:hypothetical protein